MKKILFILSILVFTSCTSRSQIEGLVKDHPDPLFKCSERITFAILDKVSVGETLVEGRICTDTKTGFKYLMSSNGVFSRYHDNVSERNNLDEIKQSAEELFKSIMFYNMYINKGVDK